MLENYPFDPHVVFWILLAVEVAGLMSASLVRLTHGCRSHSSCQWLFFACLSLVGCGSVVAMVISPICWLLSGGTLAMMIVSVVWARSHEQAFEA
ncbi:MAG TPA: hypothetical protein VMF30_16655 [Pirellulales bacterium]|nr:hypothetical protein [Pirellulales bacterium]